MLYVFHILPKSPPTKILKFSFKRRLARYDGAHTGCQRSRVWSCDVPDSGLRSRGMSNLMPKCHHVMFPKMNNECFVLAFFFPPNICRFKLRLTSARGAKFTRIPLRSRCSASLPLSLWEFLCLKIGSSPDCHCSLSTEHSFLDLCPIIRAGFPAEVQGFKWCSVLF